MGLFDFFKKPVGKGKEDNRNWYREKKHDKKEWISPGGINYSILVNEKLDELRELGGDEETIEELKGEIKNIIANPSNEEWIEANINRTISAKKTYITVINAGKKAVEDKNNKILNDQLSRIEQQYPKEEQEFYKTYAKEQYKRGEPIDFKKVTEAMKKHLETVGYGENFVNEFMTKINQEIKSSNNPQVTLTQIITGLAGNIGVIKKDKEILNKRIEAEMNPQNISDSDRRFEFFYDELFRRNLRRGYLSVLKENRISIMKAEFDIKYGHDRKDELINLSENQLMMLGYIEETISGRFDEIQKNKKGSDFVREVSNVTNEFAQRNIRNLEDYTDEINMEMINDIAKKAGVTGKVLIENFLAGSDERLKFLYKSIDENILVPPDRSSEIAEKYNKKIQEYISENPIPDISEFENMNPDQIEEALHAEANRDAFVSDMNLESMLKQMESQITHLTTMRFWR